MPPTFTPHTKGARASRAPTTVPMGRALRARPIGTVVFPFVCGVNVGCLLCGTSIDSTDPADSTDSIDSIGSIESIECIESIESIESTESGISGVSEVSGVSAVSGVSWV